MVRELERDSGDAVARGLASVLHSMVQGRDPYTGSHISRVAWLAVRVAAKMGMEPERVLGLKLGAELHDLGKFSISTEVLNKSGQLSAGELALIREHPKRGFDIVRRFTWPGPVPEMVLQHHERINGSGYPHGMDGRAMLMEAKVIAVADVVDAMLSHRPYRPALHRAVALDTLADGRGTLYEPVVVDACTDLFNDPAFSLPGEDADFTQLADRS